MKRFYKSIKGQIEKANETYMIKANKHKKSSIFQPTGLVWFNLKKEWFPSKRKNKLAPRVDEPFEVIAKVGDNAYKVTLSDELLGILATFNVGDLSPYLEDERFSNLRTNLL